MTGSPTDKLERRLLRNIGEAIGAFSLIEESDRILVAVSGGKDSYTLLHLLLRLQRRAPVRFELAAANVDPGWPGYRKDEIERHVEGLGVPMHMVEAPIGRLAAEKLGPGQAACPLCSRMRRGVLYTLCQGEGYNKLALGHHLDDAIETLLLNTFFSGALRSMPPRLTRDEPPEVIRPLCYALERDVAAYAAARDFPVVPCASARCGDEDQQRQVLKRWLTEMERAHPQIKHNARRALSNVDARFLYIPRSGSEG